MIPETLFFHEGKMDFLLTMDKEMCLTIDPRRQMDRVTLEVFFNNRAKERRAEAFEYGYVKQLMKKEANKNVQQQ